MKKPRIQIRENSRIAKLAARKLGSRQVAIVFGRSIHLHKTSIQEFISNAEWLNHELKHVEQYERMGWLPFLVKYLIEHIRKGYWDNALEAEARAAEQDHSLPEKFNLSFYADATKSGIKARE